MSSPFGGLFHGEDRLIPAIIGLALALIGIVLLARAKPPLAAESVPGINHSPDGSSPPASD